MVRLVILVVLAWLLPIALAFAHAALVASVPADGAVLTDMPATARLSFNEPVSPLVLTLRSPDGTVVPLGPVAGPTAMFDLPLPEGAGDGARVLTWRVVSADGHPVAGSLVFVVGAADGAAPEAALGDARVPPLVHAVRVALFAALFFGVGGVFHAAVVAGAAAPVWTTVCLATGLVLVPFAAALNGLDLLGFDLTAIASAAPFAATAGTSTALSLSLAAAAFVVALAAGRLAPALRPAAAVLGIVLVGAALAVSGHAATAPPEVLTRTALVLHGAALAVWLGALPMLAGALRRDAAGSRASLARFSSLAPIAIAAIVLGGTGLVFAQMRGIDDLCTTAWGRILAVKLVLVGLLLAVAALNRWRWTPPALAGDAAATRSLGRAIRLEILLALAILATVGIWRFTPPPRTLVTDAVAEETLHRHLHGGGMMADVTVSPGAAGPVRLRVDVYREMGEGLSPLEVKVQLSQAEAGIEPIRRTLRSVGDGAFESDGLLLPAGGTWRLRLDILVTDFEVVRLEDSVALTD